MICTTIIPTVGRASLYETLDSLFQERGTNPLHNVIVVNDSGTPLTKQIDDFGKRVQVLDSRVSSCAGARNAGAAISNSSYLHFLDDDDEMLPGWFDQFVEASRRDCRAVVLYGGVELRDGRGRLLGTVNLGRSGNCASQLLAGSWIQTGSAWIKSDAFFLVGAFDGTFKISEETDLFRRLSLLGDFHNVETAVAQVRRGDGWSSAVDYGLAVELLRSSREKFLNAEESFWRLRSSAAGNGYWHGRNLKAYLASAVYNFRNQRPALGFERLLNAATYGVLTGPVMFTQKFWRALRDTQVPCTQDRVLSNRTQTSIDDPT